MSEFARSQQLIKGILTGEPNPSNGTEPPPAQDGDQNTEKNVDVSSEQEVKSEAQETPNPQEGQSDTKKPSRRRKAKLGDKEFEFEVLTDDIDLDLVPKGLMMEWDYQKKTASLSEERKILDEKKSQLDQALSETANILAFEAQRFDTDEMKELKENDPETYWEEYTKLESKVKTYQENKRKREEELQKKHQELIQNEKSQYSQVIPEWLDDGVMNSDMEAIKKTVVNNGFSEDEAGAIYDRRLVSLLRKAMLYEQIQAQNIESKRVKEDPPKSVSSNSKSTYEPKKSRLSELKERQKKNKGRNLKDSQVLIKTILGG